jgi:ubiquinone/menaquinone biosynthesis C-methylase UbiE
MIDYSEYQQMQRNYYNDTCLSPNQIVGNYLWHENFPYESQLLFKYGDFRRPLLENMNDKVALDFACGPGRMIRRMSSMFKQVDGCDISHRLLSEAKERLDHEKITSNLYLTSGDNLGDVPKNHYDFIYSTIAMQHICVHSIRMNILASMAECLKDGGCINLQMCFNKVPTDETRRFSKWHDDYVTAGTTNAGHDVVITGEDLAAVKSDFDSIFKDTSFWFYDCSLLWDNFDGAVVILIIGALIGFL